MDIYYTNGTSKDVRGNCGHRHRNIRTAAECKASDSAGCRRQGGYSDRSLVVVEDGESRRPTEDEYNEWQYHQEAH